MDIRLFQDIIPSPLLRRFQRTSEEPPRTDFDEFGALRDLLTSRHSFLNPARADSTKGEFDLLLGGGNASCTPAALAIKLPWLLSASAWYRKIEILDRHLDLLRTIAMSTPSLASFKPIPLLRQLVTELHGLLREIKDDIGEEESQAFVKLQTLRDAINQCTALIRSPVQYTGCRGLH
jgi:hypothetical protein